MEPTSRHRVRELRVAAALFCIAGLVAPAAPASTLKPETVAAFDRYVELAEKRMDAELQDGHFLFPDSLPADARAGAYDSMKRGEAYVAPLQTFDEGQKIKVPGGLIHDWVGVVFIPRKSVANVLAVLQDYADETKIYKPDIKAAKVISHQDNDFVIYLRMYSKSIVSVAFNASFAVHNRDYGPDRAGSRSYSTRIAEIADPGEPDEHELPVGNDHGYMWRLNSYWRIEQKDGGVYVQIESIELSRTIPTELRIFFGFIVDNFPRKAITRLLAQTRNGVLNPITPR